MRIGINGRFLTALRTGVQRAAYNLITTILQMDRENQYFLFTGYDQVDLSDWDYPNVKVVGSNLDPKSPLQNIFWEQVKLPKLANEYAIDILHSPANMAPLRYSGKTIIHIHDLCFLVNPQWYSYAFRTWYNFVIPLLAKQSTFIVTNSNNSKNARLKRWKR